MNKMIKQELDDYIQRQFNNGHDAATIKEHLIIHGYIPEIAQEAIKHSKNYKKTKEHREKKQMHIPFSVGSVAFLFICIALFGMSIYWSGQSLFRSDDLTGVAIEPIEDIEPVEEDMQENVEENEEISITENKDIHTTQEESGSGTSTEEQYVTETLPKEPTENVIEFDNDKDGLTDNQEKEFGTDRLDQDTDNDGHFDGEEIEKGTDPLNNEDPGVVYCATAKDCNTGEGCNDDGICVACSDSDGTNYKVKGTTSGTHYTNNKAQISTDSCSSGMLLEFYCRADGYLFYKEINCAMEFGEEYYCSEGKCGKG